MFLNRWLHSLCSWIHSLLHPRAKENPMHHEPPRCEDQPEILHVVTCISNPAGYESRVRLYREFVKHITSFPSVKLWVIEGAHPGRPFQVTDENNPQHFRVHLKDEIWHKENLLNVLIKKLPPEAKKIAWIDADVHFVRPDWVEATLAALDRHPIVQLFSQCADVDNHFKLLPTDKSGEIMNGMIYEWQRQKCNHIPPSNYGGPQHGTTGGKRQPGHCGYSWSARREVIEMIGGLFDVSIVGSADYQMAVAWMTDIMDAVAYEAHPGYLEALKDWGKKVAVVRAKYGDVGYIDGLVLHSFHGYKWHRFYDKRHKFYKNFDPNRDLIRDEQGITCWNVNNPEHNAELVKELQWYHRHRKEDARYPEYPIDTVEPAK